MGSVIDNGRGNRLIEGKPGIVLVTQYQQSVQIDLEAQQTKLESRLVEWICESRTTTSVKMLFTEEVAGML